MQHDGFCDECGAPDGTWPSAVEPFTDREARTFAFLFKEIAPAFRDAMRHLREHAGMSQRQMARELSRLGVAIDSTAITRIESGKRSVRIDEAWAIAAVLRVQVQDLVSEQTTMASPEELLESAQQMLQEAERRYQAQEESLREWRDRVAELRDEVAARKAGHDV